MLQLAMNPGAGNGILMVNKSTNAASQLLIIIRRMPITNQQDLPLLPAQALGFAPCEHFPFPNNPFGGKQ